MENWRKGEIFWQEVKFCSGSETRPTSDFSRSFGAFQPSSQSALHLSIIVLVRCQFHAHILTYGGYTPPFELQSQTGLLGGSGGQVPVASGVHNPMHGAVTPRRAPFQATWCAFPPPPAAHLSQDPAQRCQQDQRGPTEPGQGVLVVCSNSLLHPLVSISRMVLTPLV